MHKNKKYGCCKKRFTIPVQLLFLFVFMQVSLAQDTTKIIPANDSVILKQEPVVHSPRKAAIYSTMLPGLGQAYNKKYWKIPVLYAGIGGLTYAIIANNKSYLNHRYAYRLRMDDDPTTIDEYGDPTDKINYLSDDYLLSKTKYYHRWRDLSIFGVALLYVLNIVDATVDAHLFFFDVSDDLSLHIQPAWITTAGTGNIRSNITGLSVHLNF